MRLSLVNLDDENLSDEVYVWVPGSVEPVVCAVPLEGLPHFLPLLANATADLPEARCPACGEDPTAKR